MNDEYNDISNLIINNIDYIDNINNINKNKIILFFNNIIINQNKNKLCRSARKIYIDKNSYIRVNNNKNNYCNVIDSTGSGYSSWFYYNSISDGLGFIINSGNKWNWQKLTNNNIIQVI